jgi:heat shock protein HslJ
MKANILFALTAVIIMSGCTSQSNNKNRTGISTAVVITDKNWKLIELKGKKITQIDASVKEPFLFLNGNDKKVTGNGGCNSFFGTYRLSAGNKISFSDIGSTKMACPDMDVESQFFQVLSETDNYSVSGDTLNFKKGQIDALAKFVFVTGK